MLQALESEGANGHFVMFEFEEACDNVPREASVKEAAMSCSEPARQVSLSLPTDYSLLIPRRWRYIGLQHKAISP